MNKKKLFLYIFLISSLIFFIFLWMDQSEKQQLKIQSIPFTEKLFQEIKNEFLQGFSCFSDPETMDDKNNQQKIYLIQTFKKNMTCKYLKDSEKQMISNLKWEIQLKKIAGHNFFHISLSYLYSGKAKIHELRSFQSEAISPSSFALIGLSSEGQDFQWNRNKVQIKIYGDIFLRSENLSSSTLNEFLPEDKDSIFYGKSTKLKVVDYESLGSMTEKFQGKNIFLGSRLPVPTSESFFSKIQNLSKWSLERMPTWQKNAGFKMDELPRSLQETCFLKESLIPHWLLLTQPKMEISLDLRQGTNDGIVCGSIVAPKITLNVHGRVFFIGQIITENLNLIGDGELILIHPDHWLSFQSHLNVPKDYLHLETFLDQNWQGFLRSYGTHLRLPFDSEGWMLPAKEFWSEKYDFDNGAWKFQESDFLNFWNHLIEVQ